MAALVTGSRLLNRHLNAIMKACHQRPNADERFDRARNADLRKAIADARAVLVPANYIERVLQLAQQGFTSCCSRSTTPTGTRRPTTPSPGRTATTPCASTTSSWRPWRRTAPGIFTGAPRRKRRDVKAGRPKPKKTLRARDLWDEIAYAAWSCADPGAPVRHDHQRVAHLPGGRADQCVEPVLHHGRYAHCGRRRPECGPDPRSCRTGCQRLCLGPPGEQDGHRPDVQHRRQAPERTGLPRDARRRLCPSARLTTILSCCGTAPTGRSRICMRAIRSTRSIPSPPAEKDADQAAVRLHRPRLAGSVPMDLGGGPRRAAGRLPHPSSRLQQPE